jgi:hypothetical protein
MLVRMPVRMRMHDSGGVPVQVLMDQVHPAEKLRIANDLPRMACGRQPASFQQDTAIGDIEGQIQIVGRNHHRAFSVAE